MDAEDLACIMLLCPDMVDDDELLMYVLADCEDREPLHYKYDRFDKSAISDEEFKQYFRFDKHHIETLCKLLGL